MLDELIKRRVLIVLGKGGVGRTAVSAALGLATARTGRRVCVIEYDTGAPMAAMFGHAPAYVPIEVESGLFLAALNGPRTLEEYLSLTVPSPRVLRSVLSSRLYNYFIQAAPGLRELIMIGKLYHEIERRPANLPPWDVVIFDGPASGQALDLLRMPATAHETFGASIVGREAHNVTAFLHDPTKCAVVQIATADGLAVSETIEFHQALKDIAMPPAAIVFNRKFSVPYGPPAVSALAHLAQRPNGSEWGSYAVRARRLLDAADRTDQAAHTLHEQTGTPIIELAEHLNVHGRELIEKLAAELAVGFNRHRPSREKSIHLG
ncbi:MAG: hypothetical protein IVW54_01275 [Candidatus Binataceae bacterium]|nr:hypothetical protein [Candidatus Binataceae bacterium]